jgi:exo-beta-1,3-glucanase (GH17 family)/Flp pilus assembly protein TadD
MKHRPVTSLIHTIKSIRVCLVAMFILLMNPAEPAAAEVKVITDSLTIVTYHVDPPNPMPRFYEGQSHQGVQRRIYPYPMNDNLTQIKKDSSYHVVRFENEFIDIGIMPGMGGRIFYAEDKTNGYDWFYRQSVIKPSLIGMVGYWISGANAWGFPHHHGPNTVQPMDYLIQSNEDGSRTIWIANTDKRHRMRILIGYTVYPNSSLVEMTIRPMNPTPIVNSFLFWANPSVHVDTNYQVIFPPSVQFVTQHAKREMTTWPIADRRYNHYDYTGLDISMWKNIGVPSSFFSWDPKEDFFGGYDHGKEAGTVWIGNHRVSPGMKFWAWGNNPAGDRANASLTDDDGHYIELMAGSYTDNQPDYSWIQPYEGKDVTMIWFPVRDLGGLKYANRNGALNLEMIAEREVIIRLNTTSPHENARIILKTEEAVLYENIIEISPAKPYSKSVAVPGSVTEDDLELLLLSDSGRKLIAYKPADYRTEDQEMPEPLTPPASPEEIKTVEELYLTGLRLEQFYNASLDPMLYYIEALKRDPDDYRTNTQLGIRAIKNKDWEEAEYRLRKAVNRITANYTRSRDGEAQYYLGFILKAQGRLAEAYDYLYDASWNSAWRTAAYHQLAEIDCQRGDFELALQHITMAISTNIDNVSALSLRAAILRRQNKLAEAVDEAKSVIEKDPLNHQARNELFLGLQQAGDQEQASSVLAELTDIMRNEHESYLELAVHYSNAGFIHEAADVLTRLDTATASWPMLYYYLGYYSDQLDRPQEAMKYYRKAAATDYIYCFPFRWESIEVLKHAMRMNPDDAMAPYYLGNLLYEHQPQKAVEYWEDSRQKDDTFYIVHRNLALAYEDADKNISKAVESMEKAVALNSDDPRLLFEMDKLYEQNRTSSQTKYALLKENEHIVQRRSETLLRLATRSVEVGKYDEALDIINNHVFPQFEGGREMQDTYLNALVLQGLRYMDAGEYNHALNLFRTALDYPVGRFGRPRWAQFHYLKGIVQERLGNNQEAVTAYDNCIRSDSETWGRDQEYLYYQALALRKKDKAKEAETILQEMLERAQSQTVSAFFRQFEGGESEARQHAANYYLAGLAYKGLGKNEEAVEAFQEAVAFHPGDVWSNYHLSAIQTTEEQVKTLQQSRDDLLAGITRAVAYSGFRSGQHPDRGDGAVNPTDEQILEDLEILTKESNFRLIRLYDSRENSEAVLRIIRENNVDLKVMLGIWLSAEISNHEGCPWLDEPIPDSVLDENKVLNLEEIEKGIRLAREYEDIIVAVNVGNEALVSWTDHMVETDILIEYVRNVKNNVSQPVTVAENYFWWATEGAVLANDVDFIGVHTYPVWEGKDIDEGLSFTIENLQLVRDALPDRPMVIAEAGWATIASEFGERASEEKQMRYYKELFDWASDMNITTFWFEAFDEDWKGDPNDPMGAEKHWGLFTVEREAKLLMQHLYPELAPENR